MPRQGHKRKRPSLAVDEETDTEPSVTPAGTPSNTPSPAKKSRKDMSPAEKDASWLEDHGYQQMTAKQILGNSSTHTFVVLPDLM